MMGMLIQSLSIINKLLEAYNDYVEFAVLHGHLMAELDSNTGLLTPRKRLFPQHHIIVTGRDTNHPNTLAYRIQSLTAYSFKSCKVKCVGKLRIS